MYIICIIYSIPIMSWDFLGVGTFIRALGPLHPERATRTPTITPLKGRHLSPGNTSKLHALSCEMTIA